MCRLKITSTPIPPDSFLQLQYWIGEITFRCCLVCRAQRAHHWPEYDSAAAYWCWQLWWQLVSHQKWMKSWCSTVRSHGNVGNTARICSNCAFAHTPPAFNRAAKRFNEPQTFIAPLNLSCISQGQSALNYSRGSPCCFAFLCRKTWETINHWLFKASLLLL